MSSYVGYEGSAQVTAGAIAEVTQFQHTNSATLVDGSSLGQDAKKHKPVQKDGQGSLTMWWDPTDANGQRTLTPGAIIPLMLYPTGESAGSKLTGDATIESVDLQLEKDNLVGRQVSYRGYLPETDIA